MVFKGGKESIYPGKAIALRLHEEGKPISIEKCMDFYLANRMADVPLLAICDHRSGKLLGYRLYRTENILHAARSSR